MTDRWWIARALAAAAALVPVGAAAEPDGAWVQAASIPPGEGPGLADGFSAWLLQSDVGAGAGGIGHEATILRVMGAARIQRDGAYQLYRVNFRCRGFEYIVISQTSYALDGTEILTTEGDRLARTYERSGLRGVGDAVCDGVTPARARTAASVEEAVALPQHIARSDAGLDD